jgi:hypothetical protein
MYPLLENADAPAVMTSDDERPKRRRGLSPAVSPIASPTASPIATINRVFSAKSSPARRDHLPTPKKSRTIKPKTVASSQLQSNIMNNSYTSGEEDNSSVSIKLQPVITIEDSVAMHDSLDDASLDTPKKAIASNSEVENLKKQLAETQELLKQTLSSINTTRVTVPQPNVAVNAPLVHMESSGSSSMPPPIMSMQLPPTQFPTKTVPCSMNYMQFNFMMQMQRDNIRVQAERELQLERAKEDKIKAQELLIYQTMIAYNMFNNSS